MHEHFVQPADMAGVSWVLSGEVQLTNVVERLKRFYNLHVDNEGVLAPICTVLNPERAGVRYFDTDTWVGMYYGGFSVRIERHFRSITGPHPAKLIYKSKQNSRTHWIATLQIADTMFYNETLIFERLTDGIRNQDFFIAPRSYKDTVVI